MAVEDTYNWTLKTLTSQTWSAERFKKWKGNNRTFEPALQRFLYLNDECFRFLSISGRVKGENYQSALELSASNYIGAIPLLRPDSGTDFGVLSVVGRYGEHPEELISLIQDHIRPEYNYEWPLRIKPLISPPIFMECGMFIDKYLRVCQSNWNKFSNVLQRSPRIYGSTQWDEYAIRIAVDPMERGQFVSKRNILSGNHLERHYLNYVCNLAIEILSGNYVPEPFKTEYGEKIVFLRTRLNKEASKKADQLIIHSSDSLLVKETKRLGNLILENRSGANYAWRMDYSEFFERFVQYILGETAKRRNFSIVANRRHSIRGAHPNWGLSYLEPDIVLTSSEKTIIADAKYKSHIYNWNENTDDLYQAYRHDLHQVLAYTSLYKDCSTAFLIYPFNSFRKEKIEVVGSHPVDVFLIGISLQRDSLDETINFLAELL